MSVFMDAVLAEAKKRGKTVVLPEGEEIRIIEATKKIVAGQIAKVILLGDPAVIEEKAGGKLEGVTIIDPKTSSKTADYANLLYELRKKKGMTPEKAKSLALDPLYFGCLMVKAGDADGMVAGSVHATGDVLRPALQIIKTKPGISTVSACFVLAMPEGSPFGENGVMVFGDCAVMPCPTSEQLVDIANASVDSARRIARMSDPKVAMLSFSTRGSAKHELVDKVKKAVDLMKEQGVDYKFDGEIQLDAALVPEVAALKAPGSPIGGNANILIFPDLQAGNIGYKLVQRFGNAEAYGPICQGLAAPVNDLSRGCCCNDVVGVVAITALQA